MYFDHIRFIGQSTIVLPLLGNWTPSTRFRLESADGLGPPEVDVRIFERAGSEGSYQGRRPQAREMTFLIGLNPNDAIDETPEMLRDQIYGLFSSVNNDGINVQFLRNETVVMRTTSWLKKCDLALFTQNPKVQLTLACAGPYFSEPTTTELVSEIPPSNYHLVIDNKGTAPTGFRAELTFDNAIGQFVIFGNAEGTKVLMTITYPFQKDDRLIIDTNDGKRNVTRIRDGASTNLLYAMTPTSIWPQLKGGENHFYLYPPFQFTWRSISFTAKYWGV